MHQLVYGRHNETVRKRTRSLQQNMVEVPSCCRATSLSLLLEALSVSKDWWNQITEAFWSEMCYQVSENSVWGKGLGSFHKTTTKSTHPAAAQTNRVNGKRWAHSNRPAMGPDLEPIENLRRELKSAIAKRIHVNLKELECREMEECQKLPADMLQEASNGYERNIHRLLLLPKVLKPSISEGCP